MSAQVSGFRWAERHFGADGNLAYSSGYYSEADNVVRQKPYKTVDISAEWRPDPGALSIRLWVKNLTGTRYYDSLAVLPTAGVLQNPAAPRRVGLSVEFAFQASESKCGEVQRSTA